MAQKMIEIASLVLLSFSVTSAFAADGTRKFTVVEGSSKAEFVAVGRPSMLKIHGSGAKPHGSLTSDGKEFSGDILVSLAELSTGIQMRDKHMKEKYLETGKPEFAEAKLKISHAPSSCLLEGSKTEEGSCTFPAQLSLHGHEKTVSVSLTSRRTGKELGENARFSLKVSDFGIELPSFAGITMADEVNVEAELKLQ